ncbi:MAG: response regulator [Actinomycetales bacterium]|jgi:DNA-binding NarL/FixJ family response regulator|nr:response regulator transcription factor [Leifsonia sp.]
MNRSVVLADDHALFRQGVRSLIEGQFLILGEAPNGHDAILLVTRTQPDVLLLDVEMPGPTAEQTVTRIRRASPMTAIVILTMHTDAVLERQLLRAGASQFVSKTIDGRGLRKIVAEVRVSSIVASPNPPGDSRAAEILTSRELEVLRMISQAYTNRDISQRLSIAEGTVKRHTTNIYAKLGAMSRIDAVRKAARLNLLGN